jgi:hypothetical protein
MYTFRGLGALGAGGFTGESFATDNRLAQQQVASNPIARAALANDSGDYGGAGAAVTPFVDQSRQIAQARAEAEAAAAARRAEIEAAEGGECRALAEQFIAAATAAGMQVPPIESLMNECLLTGPAEFQARLQAAGVNTDGGGGSAPTSTGKKVAIGVGVGLAALALFSFFK